MRPTDQNRVIYDEHTNQKMDGTFPFNGKQPFPKMPEGLKAPEIWWEAYLSALGGLSSNHDLTPNNNPTFITDEAALMADRALAAFCFRFTR